jgi:Zn-dependent protease
MELFFDFGDVAPAGELFLYQFTVVNAALGVLTLLPIPPLDGARILWAYAPRTHGWQQARYHLEERSIGIGLCLLLLLPIFGGQGLLFRLTMAIADAFVDPIAAGFGMVVL